MNARKHTRLLDGRTASRYLRPFIFAGVALMLLAAAAAGYIQYRIERGITAVVEDRLYRSSQLTPELLARRASELGIAAVVDLRHPGYGHGRYPPSAIRAKIASEREALEALGINHVSIPSHQVPGEDTVENFLAAIDANESKPILIHCYHGLGRTGLFVALFLIEYEGLTNEEALGQAARYYSMRPGGRRGFRPESDKGEFILNYNRRNRMEQDQL